MLLCALSTRKNVLSTALSRLNFATSSPSIASKANSLKTPVPLLKMSSFLSFFMEFKDFTSSFKCGYKLGSPFAVSVIKSNSSPLSKATCTCDTTSSTFGAF